MTAKRNGRHATPSVAPRVRVAVYTRKSTSEGLDQEFNSLDAQRQAVLAYVESQRGEGWVALSEHYDDGGFTGANTDRPAFQRLLKDVDAGHIDCIAVYKLDRLSRSLTDFVGTIRRLEQRGVTFCSVTQSFNTSTSMGRLTMNLLATFGEFEREVISERTRDKMGAARRRGMWTGGRPVLGYDVRNKKLVVNADEATQVREVFRIYLELGSLLAVAQELRRRGWRTKNLVSQEGRRHAGKDYDKHAVRRLLANQLYVGKTMCRGEAFAGSHEAIIDPTTWEAVQRQLATHGRHGGREVRNKHGALLKGLVRCGVCGEALGHQFTDKGGKLYRFYVCQRAQKQGANACPGSRASAPALERLVVERIRGIGRDAAMIERVAKGAREESERRLPEITAELRRIAQENQRIHAERENLVDAVGAGGPATHLLMQRLPELETKVETLDRRREELQAEVDAIQSTQVDAASLRDSLAAFEPVWNELFPREQARILQLLIGEVRYDAREGEVAITFRPGGICTLASEVMVATP